MATLSWLEKITVWVSSPEAEGEAMNETACCVSYVSFRRCNLFGELDFCTTG